MPEEPYEPDGRLEHPTVRHEPRDASFPWIVGVVLGAVALGASIHVALWYFFTGYNEHLSEVRSSPYPLAPLPAQDLPSEPRLEQLDRLAEISVSNVYERRQQRLAILESYGPTKEKGYVHIPIDQAIKLLADKLPVRPQPEETVHDRGLVHGGEPNSGRLFREKPK